MDSGIDAQAALPKLYASSRAIHCHHTRYDAIRDEVFANFAASVRGSIRKPPHTLQWATSLKKLGATDDVTAQAIIKAWNARSSRAGQLVGARSIGVRNILSLMPSSVQEMIVSHISECGWENSALSDDVLQSKKLYPPHAFRTTCQEWTGRGKVTATSMGAACAHFISSFLQKPKNARVKPDRAK